ncbi:GNAT family N-acetyltransferase [Nocardia farcinica]|nr:GNAT family N-acetyltransferase [Nocardia farcinica]
MREAVLTTRLALRLFEPGHVAALHEIFADPATHPIGEGPFSDIAATEAWIQHRITPRAGTGLCWYGVHHRGTGALLGNCGVFPRRTGAREPEIGYEIRARDQGHGFAREAATAVLAEDLRPHPSMSNSPHPHELVGRRASFGIVEEAVVLGVGDPGQIAHPGPARVRQLLDQLRDRHRRVRQFDGGDAVPADRAAGMPDEHQANGASAAQPQQPGHRARAEQVRAARSGSRSGRPAATPSPSAPPAARFCLPGS